MYNCQSLKGAISVLIGEGSRKEFKLSVLKIGINSLLTPKYCLVCSTREINVPSITIMI